MHEQSIRTGAAETANSVNFAAEQFKNNKVGAEKTPSGISLEPKMNHKVISSLDHNETAAALYTGVNSFSIDNKDFNERYKAVSVITGGEEGED